MHKSRKTDQNCLDLVDASSLTVRVVDISRREYCIVNNPRAQEQNRADDCWLATPSLTIFATIMLYIL